MKVKFPHLIAAAILFCCTSCIAHKNTPTTDEAPYPAGLPQALRKPANDGWLPAPVLESGKTQVHFHLLRPKETPLKEYDILMFVNTLFNDQEQHKLHLDSSGIASVNLNLDGPGYAIFVEINEEENMMRSIATLWLAPGDTTEVYVDGNIDALLDRLWANDEEHPTAPQPVPHPNGYIYTTGRYADLNRFISKYRFTDNQEWRNLEFSLQLSGDEYTDSLQAHYLTSVQTIQAQPWPEMYKAYSIAGLQQHIMEMLLRPAKKRSYQTRSRQPIAADDTVRTWIEDRHFRQIGRLFNTDSPSILLGDNLLAYCRLCAHTEAAGHGPGGLCQQLHKALKLKTDAQNGNLTLSEDDKRQLGPFFINALTQKDMKAKEAKRKSEKRILPTPDVPLEELFEAIIAPHKGKVVVVDFWNTWCAPCRYAISQIEPLKTTTLASDDVVWIYIADESSPMEKYAELTANIKGLHYRLSKTEWRQLTDKDFPEIDGIPSYVLVDKTGKARLAPEFIDHAQLEKTIKSIVEAEKKE